MDGSFGCKGNVVELLGQHICGMKRPIQVFACGPEAMFQEPGGPAPATSRCPARCWWKSGWPAASASASAACRKTLDENEPYKRVCKEGPVFDLWQISL